MDSDDFEQALEADMAEMLTSLQNTMISGSPHNAAITEMSPTSYKFNPDIQVSPPMEKKKKKKKKAKSAACSLPEFQVAQDHPLRHGLNAAAKLHDAILNELESEKARSRDRRTFCGHCGSEAPKGKHLQRCTRCRAVNYCSESCQRVHYKSTHKEECVGFAHPPFAKHFETADHHDVPWPIDPVFASTARDGVGIWVTTNSGIDLHLHQAFEPVDPRAGTAGTFGTTSYQKWSGITDPSKSRGMGKNILKYHGFTIFGLRLLVQNRRTDGKVVIIRPVNATLAARGVLKPNILEKDMEEVNRLSQECRMRDDLMIAPWTDYTGHKRVAILEINGVSAPIGKFTTDNKQLAPGEPPWARVTEYQYPTKPAGAPWDRVLDWDVGTLALRPGDFAVVSVQYRIGDSADYQVYPMIMCHSYGVGLPYRICTTTSIAAAAHEPMPGRQMLGYKALVAMWNMKYIEEYFQPYVDGSGFGPLRMGQRAQHVNDMIKELAPQHMEMLLGKMSSDEGAEFLSRLSYLSGYDMEEALKTSKAEREARNHGH